MAIGIIFNVPGGTQEQYDAVLEQLNLSGSMPPGGISHAAGPIEGGWRVVEVWESEEAADAFFREQLDQALRNAGVPEPQLETWTVYKTLEPAVS